MYKRQSLLQGRSRTLALITLWARLLQPTWLGAGALSLILASSKEPDPCSHHSVGQVAPTHLAWCKCLVFYPCLKLCPLPASLRLMKAVPTQLQWCRGIVLDPCLKKGAGPLPSLLCGPSEPRLSQAIWLGAGALSLILVSSKEQDPFLSSLCLRQVPCH